MREIRKHLTTKNHTKGRTQKIQYIGIHYTYGASTAEGAAYANCVYFARESPGASAHLFIDDGPVSWQSVEDKDTAWAVGSASGKYKHAKARNANTLSIEVCTKGAFTAKEIENLRWLVLLKMKEHGVPAANVIRHYDVTGKLCPAYYVDETLWKELHAYITSPTATVPTPEVPVKSTYKVMALSTRMAGARPADVEFEAALKALCKKYDKALFEVKEASPLPPNLKDWWRVQ